MSTTHEYVTDVLGFTKNPDENEQDYLQRLAFTLQSLSEDEWNDLPTDLQDWYNKAADVIAAASDDEEVTIDSLPGTNKAKKAKKVKKLEQSVEELAETLEEVIEEEVEDALEEAAEKPKRGRPRKAEKAPKEPRQKKEKAPKEPKGPTAANAVREILCENMDLSLDQIMSELEKRGVEMKRNSMQVVALNTKQAFVIAAQIGEVKNGEGAVVLLKG